jgi:hypothetical protein
MHRDTRSIGVSQAAASTWPIKKEILSGSKLILGISARPNSRGTFGVWANPKCVDLSKAVAKLLRLDPVRTGDPKLPQASQEISGQSLLEAGAA